MTRWLIGLSCLVSVLFLAATGVGAQETDEPEPVLVTADEIVYDDALGIVVARGNVELSQGERVLLADTVTYNQSTQIVTATGNVTIEEPSGDLVFAEYAELTDDLAEGFVETISMLFVDDSRMIANIGLRDRDGTTDVERVVYSPCDVCSDDPDSAPLWQLRAVRATHDRDALDIVYRDAFIDFFGVPILYTPYFSHPDPTVDRRSGFLTPSFGSTPDLGPFFRSAYYYDIAPEQDATFNLAWTRDAGFQGGAEYRRRFQDGDLVIEGTANRSDFTDIEDGVSVEKLDQFRWHLFGDARYDLDENWRFGGSLRRTSDDTYLDVFEISEDDVLESRGYAEGFYDLSYISAEVYGFQDLRVNSIDQPIVAPWIDFDYVGEPGSVVGGQLHARGDILNLMRPEGISGTRRLDTEGVDTRRLSAGAGWRREFVTDFGLLTDFRADIDGYLYMSNDVPDQSDPDQLRSEVSAARVFPRGTITSRYPFVRQSGAYQQLIEPVVSVTAAPVAGDDDDIPNNDSLDPEFDEINLFSDNRFPGVDRLDGGTRVTYGLRGGLYDDDGGYATLFLGQSYRFDDTSSFADGSGLEDQLSDIVGRLSVSPTSIFTLDYRFRFSKDDLTARRQELSTFVGVPAAWVGATYTFIDAEAGTGTSQDTEEILSTFGSQVSEYWRLAGSYRYDLADDEPRDVRFGLIYSDECFTFDGAIRRDFTVDRNTGDGVSVFLTLTLRNLGEIPLAGSLSFPGS